MKAFNPYSHTSSFYWNSKLSAERKAEIIKWCGGLDDFGRRALATILEDVRADAQFNCDQEGGP